MNNNFSQEYWELITAVAPDVVFYSVPEKETLMEKKNSKFMLSTGLLSRRSFKALFWLTKLIYFVD